MGSSGADNQEQWNLAWVTGRLMGQAGPTVGLAQERGEENWLGRWWVSAQTAAGEKKDPFSILNLL
jgi:hypothetical protein